VAIVKGGSDGKEVADALGHGDLDRTVVYTRTFRSGAGFLRLVDE
jgi:hypothetical protein